MQTMNETSAFTTQSFLKVLTGPASRLLRPGITNRCMQRLLAALALLLALLVAASPPAQAQTPGFLLTTTTLTVAEGDSSTFAVRLATRPSTNMTVTIAASNSRLAIDTDPDTPGNQNTLAFDRFGQTNAWNQYKGVTVTALQNYDQNITITLTGAGGDYQGRTATIAATITPKGRIVLTPTGGLEFDEGGSSVFDVHLSAAPASDVTVTLTKTHSGITLDKTTLTFTSTNYASKQRVRVSSGADDDHQDISDTITLSATGGIDADDVTKPVRVVDTDTGGFDFTAAAIVLQEGDNASVGNSRTMTIRINTAPDPGSSTAKIRVTSSDTGAVTVSPSELTFSRQAWHVSGSVTIRWVPDDDGTDESVDLTISAISGYSGVADATKTITVRDDDGSITVSSAAVDITEGGSTGNFTVRLGAPPKASAVLSVSSGDTGAVTVSPASLTFTSSNWNSPQTVTVTGVQDNDGTDESVNVTVSPTSGYRADNVTKSIAVTDDDGPAGTIQVTPADTLNIDEGASGDLSVSLSAQPASDVTVSLAKTNADVTLSATSLTFTTSNWNTAQTVSVSAAQDADTTDDSDTITLTATGGITAPSVTKAVTITDDGISPPPPGAIVVTYDTGKFTLNTPEGGTNDFFVRLSAEPSSNVTVTLTKTNAEVSLSPTTLTFTTANWNTTQTVTITVAEDADAEHDSDTITLSASGGITAADVTEGMFIADNEVSWEADVDKVVVIEGSTTTFNLRLTTQPKAGIFGVATNVGLSSPSVFIDTDSSTADFQTTLNIARDSWDTYMPITVTANEDDNQTHERLTIDLTANRGSGRWEAARSALAVEVIDNDAPDPSTPTGTIQVTPAGTLTIDEGASGNLSVSLGTQPNANVTVSLTKTNGDVTLSATSLTFTTANWDTSQTVTVQIRHDDDDDNETDTITLSATGGITAPDVTKAVSITDNDEVEFSLTTTTLTLTEGGSGTFGMRPGTRPSANITVTVAASDSSKVAIDTDPDTPGNQTTLAFDRYGQTNAWNRYRTVTVTALQDNDQNNETITITATGAGGDYQGKTATVTTTITDNTVSGTINVSPGGTLTIDEGASGDLSVSLSAQPASDVTVSLAKTNADVTLSPTSLTFTSSNWGTAQSVTVSTAQDTDSADDTDTITLTATGGIDASSVSKAVTITDDDELGIIPSISPVVLDEDGSSATVGVRLTESPAFGNSSVNVAFMVTSSDTSVFTVSPDRLEFSPSGFNNRVWNVDQTLTITPVNDSVFTSAVKNATINIQAASAFSETNYGTAVGTMTIPVQVREDDTPTGTINVSPAGTLNIDEGASGALSVSLSAQPSSNVTVSLAKTNADVTLSPTSLTFTSSNWGTAQSVTVSTAQDTDSADDTDTITLTATGGIDASSVSKAVTITDDDELGIIPSISPVVLDEDGSSATVGVRLTESPAFGNSSVNVAFMVTSSDTSVFTVSPDRLEFSPSGFNNRVWNVDQTLTITPVNDSVFTSAVKNATINIQAASAFSETNYGTAVGTMTIPVQVREDDTPTGTINVSPAGTLNIDEGASGALSVSLSAQPNADVTVSLAKTNADVTLSPTSLTFTTLNWNTAQTVNVSAVQDVDSTDDTDTITLSATGGIDASSVAKAVTITDIDTTAPTVTGASVNGATLIVTFSEAMASTRAANTAWAVNVAGRLRSVSSYTLSNTTATLTLGGAVTAGQDITLGYTQPGGNDNKLQDAAGNELATFSNQGVTNVTPGLVIPTGVSVAEGNSSAFSVRLAAQPTGTVTVTVAQPSNTDITVDTDSGAAGNQTTLTFTTRNWNIAQNVIVSAAIDADMVSGGEIISITAGANYGSVTGSVGVVVNDNSIAGLVINPQILSFIEGGSGNFSVSLTMQPSENVTVTVAQPSNTDITVDTDSTAAGNQTTLTFTPSNYGIAQNVIVSAAEDVDTVSDQELINLSASGANYGSVTNVIPVIVGDNDVPGLTINPPSVRVNEGGNNSFGVSLDTQPDENVIVTVAQSGTPNSDIRLDKTTLTFTTNDWNTAQNITVSAAIDADTVNDSVNLNISASGSDYGSVTDSVSVSVTDNDSAGLTINPDTLRLNEGGGNSTFSISLVTQPSENVTVTVAPPPSNTDISVDTDGGTAGNQNTLTFTSSNWSTARRITVNAAEDADMTDDSVNLGISASGADYGNETGSVTVNVIDNDRPNLLMEPTGMMIDEGRTVAFSVKLATPPTGAVTVTMAQPSNTDITVDTDSTMAGDQVTLAFTASNYDTAQSVAVSAAIDADKVDDSANISISASGADYDGLTGSVSVSVSDTTDTAPTFGSQRQADLSLTEGVTMTPVTLPAARRGDGALQYRISPSLPSGLRFDAATRRISGTPDTPGTTRHNIIVSDSDSDTSASDQASLSFGITVRAGKNSATHQAVKGWLSRLGRGVGEQAIQGIRQRIKSSHGGQPGMAQLQTRLGGHSIDLNQPLSTTTAGLLQQLEQLDRGNSLHGSSFSFSGILGEGQFSLWGQGAHSSFASQDNSIDLDGELSSLLLGSDYRRDNWTAGIVLSRSNGEGNYRGGAIAGELESDLTSVVPWGSIQMDEDLSIWGAAGQGQGELRLKPEQESEIKTGLDWQMLAGGVQSRLIKPDESNRLGLNFTGDLLWTETTTDRVARLQAVAGETRRVRLGLEADWRSSRELTPRLELGIRHDSGDAETGLGVELGGGLAWRDGWGNRLEVNGRSLLVHSDSDFDDWGVSIVAQHDPRPSSYRGFSARLSQELGGRATGGVERLMKEDLLSADNMAAGHRWELEMAYGMARERGLTGSGYTALSGRVGEGAGSGMGWRVGYRLQSEHTSEFEIDLHVLDAREADEADPGVGLNFIWR